VIFIATGDGHYLGWYAVIRAPNEERALILSVESRKKEGLKGGKRAVEIRPLPTKREHVEVLFNGDY
jgi:hypothetical protein